MFFLLSLEYFDLEIEQVSCSFSPVVSSLNFLSTHYFISKKVFTPNTCIAECYLPWGQIEGSEILYYILVEKLGNHEFVESRVKTVGFS